LALTRFPAAAPTLEHPIFRLSVLILKPEKPMPSPAEYAANRLKSINNQSPNHASSQLTSGRTPEGRARSSMNALRHGLTARVVVLPTEDMAAYKAFSKEIVDSLDAQTPVERQFAQTVADNQWRINRIRSIEDGMLGMGHFEAAGDLDDNTNNPEVHSAMTAARAFRQHSQSFVNLSICEQRLHRSMKEALRQLKELQTERREFHKTEMDGAIRLLKTQKMKGKFVYASPETTVESDRRDRLEDSLLAEQSGFDLTRHNASRPQPPKQQAA
jgi:hypothetical protein